MSSVRELVPPVALDYGFVQLVWAVLQLVEYGAEEGEKRIIPCGRVDLVDVGAGGDEDLDDREGICCLGMLRHLV